MVVPELFIPLAIFSLLEHGCCEVFQTKSGGLVGIESIDEPERVEAVKRLYADNFVRRYAYAGTAGDRNRHEMTGRTV